MTIPDLYTAFIAFCRRPSVRRTVRRLTAPATPPVVPTAAGELPAAIDVAKRTWTAFVASGALLAVLNFLAANLPAVAANLPDKGWCAAALFVVNLGLAVYHDTMDGPK